MDRKYVEQRQIAERYLAGKLSDEEAQAFERAFLADPGILDDLDLVARLRDGVRALGAARLDAALYSGHSSLQRLRTYALAASVVGVVGLGTAMYFQLQLSQIREEVGEFGAPQVLSAVHRLEFTRSGQAIEIRNPGSDWLGLSVDASGLEGREVEISLGPEAGLPAWKRTVTVAGHGADGAGNIEVAVTADMLPAGVHRIHLTTVDDGPRVERTFTLQVN